MTKTKSTKRALLMSGLALIACVSMLVGSTFAWFTDSVTSGSNVIQAGTLDIVMEYWDGDSWEDAEGVVLNFEVGGNYHGWQNDVLWEPGCTYKLPKIRVRNEGDLATRVILTINGITGDEKLLEAIDFTTTVTNVPDSLKTGSAAAAYSAMEGKAYPFWYGATEGTVLMDWNLMAKGHTSLNTGDTDTSAEFTISGHMKEEAGNEYQGLKIEGVSITALATQLVYEYDSFGREYDKEATFLNKDADGNWLISNAAELLYFANSVNNSKTQSAYAGEKVLLTADIDLGGREITPIGSTFNKHEFAGIFDGQNHTISNFKVDNKAGAALFGFVRYTGHGGAAKVMNLKVKDVTATGGDYVAGVVGQLYGTIENCHAENVTVVATPFLLADGVTYDGGAKAGGVVGWMESGSIYTATNCTATNVDIKAYRDLGGVLGMAHNNNVVTDLKTYGATLGYVRLASDAVYDGGKVNENMGEVIGRRGSNVVESGTYFENVKMGADLYRISTADELVDAFANMKAGNVLSIANDIDMSGKTLAAVTGNKGFTMLGNGHTIKNLASTQRGLFVAASGSAAYTFEDVVLENCFVNTTTEYGALFVGYGDTSDAITIKNCVVKNCTVKSAKYAAAFIGYTAGWNKVNDGPVYSDILIENCSVIGGSITGGGSTGAAIAHAGGNDDTTNIITGLKVDGVAINGEDAAHTGIVVGTAGVGDTIINGTVYTNVTGNYNTATVLYGRFVPNSTGTLTIDGVAQ